MATLAPQTTARTGTVITYAAAAGGGDKFLLSSGRKLRVRNGGGGSINVTLESQAACNQGSTHDEVVAVGAGVEKDIGPFTDRFADADGYVNVTYSGVTTVTVAVVD